MYLCKSVLSRCRFLDLPWNPMAYTRASKESQSIMQRQVMVVLCR